MLRSRVGSLGPDSVCLLMFKSQVVPPRVVMVGTKEINLSMLSKSQTLYTQKCVWPNICMYL